jgi:spermidine/putrescine transport system permease protein
MAFAAFGSNNPTPSNKPTRSGKVVIALLAPGLAYLGAFFLTPLFSLVMVSLQAREPFGGIGDYVPAFEINNYVVVIQLYFPQMMRSFIYAVAATVLALVFSYPLAYFIGVKARPYPLLQKLMLTLVIAPFFISFLLRTLAWKQIFSNESWIVTTLQQLGLLESDQYVVGTPFMVIFGLTYNFIPFMTLPLYTSLERLDTRYLEAGADLYATPAKVFRKVTIPLSMPGIISGTLLTFIPIAGDYINASGDFLGSSFTSMLGNVIEAKYLQTNNYPAASALSVLLMGAILILVAGYVKKSGTEDLL